jgi:hypothetical protein
MHAVLRKTQDLRIGMCHIATGCQDRFPRHQRLPSAGVHGEQHTRGRLPKCRDRRGEWSSKISILSLFAASVLITIACILFEVHLLWESAG